MEAGTTSTTLTTKLPILNLGEYDLWLMRIEQYFLMTDYSLWEDRRNEMKARGTLLMALPNKDQLKFHSYKDAKLLMLQKLISQLEIQGEVINQEDMNLKLLRSLPSEWKTHALIWRNKVKIKTISLDDFTNSNSSTNEADNTAYGVSTAHTQEDLEQLHPDDLEEMDLQWEMAMLTIRARRFIKRTGRKLDINGKRVGFVSYQAEEEHPTNFALMAHTSSGSSSNSYYEVDSCSKSCLESVEARLAHYKKNEVVFEESINVLKLEVRLRDNALVKNKNKLEKEEKERDKLKLTLEKFQNSSKSLNNLLESQLCDKFRTGLGYNTASSTAASPAVESFNSFRPSVIEDWNSDDDSEEEFIPNLEDKTVRPNTEKIEF
ncbi:hypothetical protein Tco_0757599, partial [Tanacetum coccineum]